jgi:serine protease
MRRPPGDITTGSATVRVAVIDTGITDHPDLAGRWSAAIHRGCATANDGTDAIVTRDRAIGSRQYVVPGPANISSWHGTHVAGPSSSQP